MNRVRGSFRGVIQMQQHQFSLEAQAKQVSKAPSPHLEQRNIWREELAQVDVDDGTEQELEPAFHVLGKGMEGSDVCILMCLGMK